MTRKERSFVFEGATMLVAAFLLAIVVPGLVNTHDTMLTFAGFILLGLSLAWIAYFLYRITKEYSL